MSPLVLGPILRYVDDHRATVWFETARPATITVTTSVGVTVEDHTWGLYDHHYALLVLEGLPADTAIEYGVTVTPDPTDPTDPVDPGAGPVDEPVSWPAYGPPPIFRTTGSADTPARIAFGSCRRGDDYSPGSLRQIGADALVGLAWRVQLQQPSERPQLLALLGDQVYADNPTAPILHRLRMRRAAGIGPTDAEVIDEICDFEEYTWLYHQSWSEPAVRELFAVVPTCMILDDHDLRDDWNSSAQWRAAVTATHWFRDRVIGAMSSYWVYQHLGNLSPEALARDTMYAAIRKATSDTRRELLLADFVVRADAEPSSARWSFTRDIGSTRLIMIDSRCSRSLEPGNRAVVDSREWEWVREQVFTDPPETVLFGTSLPVLMLPALHHLEQWNEATAEGAWGQRWSPLAERIRLAVDLEHWAAFAASFRAMMDLAREIVGRPDAPRRVLWLSGDVHCSYVARADIAGRSMYQLTMSPFRNPLELPIRIVNRIAGRPSVIRWARALARRAGVRESGVDWSVTDGPWFDNGVMILTVPDGPGAELAVEVAHATSSGDNVASQRLSTTAVLPLPVHPAQSAHVVSR
ncbi:alkaline phosphatase D family protein [Millisia brevis]|uniref:alkaline phosphatase D family protein n=1 Tax=Millisia brevis TaxID=264148 RepID=UPI000AE78376|nr:alkaline phosphatase D family protein [Millisia brevis]